MKGSAPSAAAAAVITAPPPDPAEVRALFAAARRRRRRRRLAAGAACLILAGSAAAGLAAAGPGRGAGTNPGQAGHAAVPHAPGTRLPPVRVAWVDDGGQLHIGNLATGTQQVVTTAAGASPADPVTTAGGRLYWAGISGPGGPVRDYDTATGATRPLARGSSVFTSADGRRLFIATTSTSLSELPAGGTGPSRRLALPAGWYLSGLLGNWTAAGGIIVYGAPDASTASALAIWNPGTGRVNVIGRDLDVIDTWTPAGARYSLIAWTKPGVLGITDTATRASLTVRSPTRYGFTDGGLFTRGAFSPDGTRLAVFVNITNPDDPAREPVSEPAILDTRTGTLRLAATARLGTYENAAWARWLPDGRQLLAGAEQGSYAINAATLAASTLPFTPGSGINFSATILPAP
jgi:hypothetical protein